MQLLLTPRLTPTVPLMMLLSLTVAATSGIMSTSLGIIRPSLGLMST
jgi:hypothetical protein